MHTTNNDNNNSISNSLHQRFQSLIWSCLDADLTRTAVFHAERYFYATNPANNTAAAATTISGSSSSSEEKEKNNNNSNSNINSNSTTTNHNHNHDARHLYATALIHEGQTYSALALVNGPKDEQCCGCLEIKARCCTLLGRHRQAREAIEEMLEDKEKKNYVGNASSNSRIAHPFPEEAALRCKAGTTALKGNVSEKAAQSFRQALKLNPFLWEAFEGLCALGPTPDIDELFPPRLPPMKLLPPEEYLTSTTTNIPILPTTTATSRPIATGAGFFTPDTVNGSGPVLGGGGGGGNLFRSFKPKQDIAVQPFRVAVSGPRDSIATNDSSFYPDNSFHGHGHGHGHGLRHQNNGLQPPSTNNSNHHPRQQAAPAPPPPPLSTSRPLSSADEAGPATKRLRSGGGGSGSDAPAGSGSGSGNPHLNPNPNPGSTAAGPGGGPTLIPKPDLQSQQQQQQGHAQVQGGSKKARLRPALSFANIFSSSSRASSLQQAVASSSRTQTHHGHVPNSNNGVVANANGRSNGNGNGVIAVGQPAMRRSTRLQSSSGAAGVGGAGASQTVVGLGKVQGSKHTTRDRRRAVGASHQQHHQKLQQIQQGRRNHSLSKSAESDRDEDMSVVTLGHSHHHHHHHHPHGHSSSPNSHTYSKSRSRSHSSRSPSLPPPPPPLPSNQLQPPTWTQAQYQAALEEYENELAEYFIYELVRKFAGATRKLSMFDCKGCVEELDKLPWGQQRSCMVVAMVARANYERQEYHAAERAFKTLRKMDPYRLWDMEIYSSLLWQLQKPIELSFLAQELLNISPRSASTWISIGNLFSLQKERSQALRSFQRAYELDPGCAYAYTLSGHEWIDEDVERAVKFFQSALRADGRHYNAWYGLGTCYLRMGRWRMAEWHFRRAVEVCPGNAVLLGCVGMAVERRGDKDKALGLFNEAVGIAPDNALVRYRRAKIYISMERYKDALVDLEYLANATPDESNVIFQLAKVYRLLGDVVKSAQALAAARDVSPKSVGKIRRLIEMGADLS